MWHCLFKCVYQMVANHWVSYTAGVRSRVFSLSRIPIKTTFVCFENKLFVCNLQLRKHEYLKIWDNSVWSCIKYNYINNIFLNFGLRRTWDSHNLVSRNKLVLNSFFNNIYIKLVAFLFTFDLCASQNSRELSFAIKLYFSSFSLFREKLKISHSS